MSYLVIGESLSGRIKVRRFRTKKIAKRYIRNKGLKGSKWLYSMKKK